MSADTGYNSAGTFNFTIYFASQVFLELIHSKIRCYIETRQGGYQLQRETNQNVHLVSIVCRHRLLAPWGSY